MNNSLTWNDSHDKWETSIKSCIKDLIEEDFLLIQAAAWCYDVLKLTIHLWLYSKQNWWTHNL